MKIKLIAATMLLAAISQAGELTWQNMNTAIVDESCVYYDGIDYNAVSFGHMVDEGANYVVNGVIFYAAGPNSIGFTSTSGITIRQFFMGGTPLDTGSKAGVASWLDL